VREPRLSHREWGFAVGTILGSFYILIYEYHDTTIPSKASSENDGFIKLPWHLPDGSYT